MDTSNINNYNQVCLPEELCGGIGTISDIEMIEKLKNAKNNGNILTGFCTKAKENGDLEVELTKNIKGIIKREDVSWKVEKDGQVHVGKCYARVGLPINFKVIKINSSDGKYEVILSRKAAMEECRQDIVDNLKEGMKVKGIVTGIMDFGVFIDIGGDVSGILGKADMARAVVRHPSDLFKVGDEIEVIVKKIYPESLKISFSRIELLPTWEEIENYYQNGDITIGILKSRIDSGWFIQLNEVYEGLADFVPNRVFQKGEHVKVKIIKIMKESKRIKLLII